MHPFAFRGATSETQTNGIYTFVSSITFRALRAKRNQHQ
jgi:hypothetical protein